MHVIPGRALLVVALLVAGPFLAAQAQQAGPRQAERGFPPGLAEARLVKEKAEDLGVKEETLKKLEKLVEETRAKDKELRARLLEATKKVDKLLDQGRPEEKALLEASAAASQISRETRLLKLQCSLKVRALLTDEQLVEFLEIRKKAMSARRKRGRRPRG